MSSYSVSPKKHLRKILLSVLTIAISAFSGRAMAQADVPGLVSQDAFKSNTVSMNQLLSSDKALRTASRARKFLVDGRLDKAQKEITEALQASPNCAIALDVQAAIHLRTGQFDDAASEFQKAINADPTIGQAYVGLGILLIARKEYKNSLVPLDRAETLMPASWLVYFETAIAHLALGDMDTALKQISTAETLASDPEKRSGTAFVRALVSIKLRDFDRAAKYMSDAIKSDPAGLYAKSARAKMAQMQSLLDPAKESLAVNKAQP